MYVQLPSSKPMLFSKGRRPEAMIFSGYTTYWSLNRLNFLLPENENAVQSLLSSLKKAARIQVLLLSYPPTYLHSLVFHR